jgi:CRP/FNR family transcriptional regulator, cyclic AMP receptor protein
MKALDAPLKEHPFFQGLSDSSLATIAGCGRNIQFAAGETIFREGEEADYFYVIRHGRVALNIHGAHQGAITIETVEAGEIIGWSWLIPPYRWRFSARCVLKTRAIALDGRCLRGKCEHDYQLGYELFKRFAHVFSERLDHTIIQLLDIYCEYPAKKSKR